jgi:hypothetical protein
VEAIDSERLVKIIDLGSDGIFINLSLFL